MYNKITDLEKVVEDENIYGSITFDLEMDNQGEFQYQMINDLNRHDIEVVKEDCLGYLFKGEKRKIQQALNYEFLKEGILLTFTLNNREETVLKDYFLYTVIFDEAENIILNNKLHFKGITSLSCTINNLNLFIGDQHIFEMSLKYLNNIGY